MIRRIAVALLLAGLAGCAPPPPAAPEPEPTREAQAITELSAVDLRDALAGGRLSSIAAVSAHLDRIDAIDRSGPAINAIIELNPQALEIAAALDARWQTSGPAGPLHGMPVLLKASIDTADEMATSAGSLALAGHRAGADAVIVRALRDAGAVILGKTNLSEWANFRDADSTSGWSSLGGQSKNPYVLDRNPCGSSSGSATAVSAALSPLAVGTETNGSIVCPAGVNGIVGIKPTVGTVSRTGIVPISHTQDTAGPMARTVTGAALLLSVMATFDPLDPMAKRYPHAPTELLPDTAQRRLDGQRIGVLRTYLGAGTEPATEAIFDEAVELLAALGAQVIDPVGYQPPETLRPAAREVLLHEFKHNLNGYLRRHEVAADRDTLTELIAFNDAHAERVMPTFGQSLFRESDARGGLEEPDYRLALEQSQVRLRADLDALLERHDLDALFYPVSAPAWLTDRENGDTYTFGGTAYLAAVTGYPSIALPAGSVEGLPVAVGFMGPPLSEAALIQTAYALEQALGFDERPGFLETRLPETRPAAETAGDG